MNLFQLLHTWTFTPELRIKLFCNSYSLNLQAVNAVTMKDARCEGLLSAEAGTTSVIVDVDVDTDLTYFFSYFSIVLTFIQILAFESIIPWTHFYVLGSGCQPVG